MNQSPGARRLTSPRYYYTTFPALCQAPGLPGYGERQKDRLIEPRSPEGGGGGKPARGGFSFGVNDTPGREPGRMSPAGNIPKGGG
jgi:hypothetical protein